MKFMVKPAVQFETVPYQSRVSVKQMNFQKWGSLIGFITCILFLILTILAMLFYPGGNRDDGMAPGFNLWFVTLSDLGRDFAINDVSNTLSQALFLTGFIILGLSLVVFYIILDMFYKDSKKIKWLSLTGLILGIISGVLYIYIAITPVDIDIHLHNKFIYSAAPFKFGALICFTIVTFVDKKLPKRFTYLILANLIVYVLLAVAVIVGSILRGDTYKITRIFGHTAAIFIEVIIVSILSLLLFIYLSKTSKLRLRTGKK